jgi:antitoxin MazE
MYTRIQKWGNSHAVRLPMSLLALTEFKENDEVDIKVEKGNIIITSIKKHQTLKDRIKDYQGDYQCSEWETGKSVGKEEF